MKDSLRDSNSVLPSNASDHDSSNITTKYTRSSKVARRAGFCADEDNNKDKMEDSKGKESRQFRTKTDLL